MRTVILLVLALAACADDDSGDGVLTADELPAAYRSAACSYFVRCGIFPDLAACQSANLPILTDGFTFDLDPNLVAAIDAGHVQLDTAEVQACLGVIAGLSCDRSGSSVGLFEHCWHFLHGTLPGGATCFLREECISNQCSGGSTLDACVAGTCVGDTPPPTTPAELGMPCSFDPGCVEGAFCDYNSTGTCVARRGLDETCVNGGECAMGLACAGTDPPRTCRPLPGLGEPCPDLVCRDAGTYCAASGMCERIGLEGDACTGGSVGECAPAYPCDTSTGTCKRAPGVGEPCDYSTYLRCFDAGLVCDETVSLCIEPRPDGQPCTVDAVCQSGHCDVLAGTCTPAMLCL